MPFETDNTVHKSSKAIETKTDKLLDDAYGIVKSHNLYKSNLPETRSETPLPSLELIVKSATAIGGDVVAAPRQNPCFVEPRMGDPLGIDPYRIEPWIKDPAQIKPVGVEPRFKDPAGIGIGILEPWRKDPLSVEPVRIELVRVEPIRIEPPKEIGEVDYRKFAHELIEARKLPEGWKHEMAKGGSIDLEKLNKELERQGSKLRIEQSKGAINMVDYNSDAAPFDSKLFGCIIDSTDPAKIGKLKIDWSDLVSPVGTKHSLNPRDNEPTRDGVANAHGDARAYNSKGQIDEFQYHDDKYPAGDEHLQNHSYKIGYDATGKANEITAPDGGKYTRLGDGGNWTHQNSSGANDVDSKVYQLGDITVDENGIHSSGWDSRVLGLPERVGVEASEKSRENAQLDKLTDKYGVNLSCIEKTKLHDALVSVKNGDIETLNSLIHGGGNSMTEDAVSAFKKALESYGFSVEENSQHLRQVEYHFDSHEFTIIDRRSGKGVRFYSEHSGDPSLLDGMRTDQEVIQAISREHPGSFGTSYEDVTAAKNVLKKRYGEIEKIEILFEEAALTTMRRWSSH